MFKNYFKTAWPNLAHNKMYSALSIPCCDYQKRCSGGVKNITQTDWFNFRSLGSGIKALFARRDASKLIINCLRWFGQWKVNS